MVLHLAGQGETQGCSCCRQHLSTKLIPWPGNLPLCPHDLWRAKAGEQAPPGCLWRNFFPTKLWFPKPTVKPSMSSTCTTSLSHSHPVSPQPSMGTGCHLFPELARMTQNICGLFWMFPVLDWQGLVLTWGWEEEQGPQSHSHPVPGVSSSC